MKLSIDSLRDQEKKARLQEIIADLSALKYFAQKADGECLHPDLHDGIEDIEQKIRSVLAL